MGLIDPEFFIDSAILAVHHIYFNFRRSGHYNGSTAIISKINLKNIDNVVKEKVTYFELSCIAP